MYWNRIQTLGDLPGRTGDIFKAASLSTPAAAAAKGPLALTPIDHVAVACTSIEELSDEWVRLLPLGRVIENTHVWPDQALNCPEVPLVDKKHMASIAIGGIRLVLLAPFSAGDVIATFLARNGGRGIHHVAFTVPDIHESMRELTVHFPSIRRVTGLAEDPGAMAQVFFKLDPEIRFVELVQREGGFDGTFTCNNVRALTEGERANGFRDR